MADQSLIVNKMTTPQPLIQLIDIVAGYGHKPILQHLNLAIHAGEIYALLGANGAGKTTTLRLLLGFIAPDSGQVLINGIDVPNQPQQACQQIAYIPESVALYEHLTAFENVDYLLSLAGQQASHDEIRQALLAAGLQQTAIDQWVSDFSKGMRQKVAIALAFTRKVPVLLLDEPTSGLDPRASDEFNGLLAILRQREVAVLMVTHDLLSASQIADRIGFISAGTIAEEIIANDQSPRFDINSLHQHYTKWATS
ncbi:ABC transporter ATP-binding protein [Acinetobacter sp. ESBL14]|uniref:ABC transporter ATP-binding protein n=1 Tax=Acinetobacter sp. ESBL14 TaxID=3077329 RepID=UPI002FC905F7